MRFNAVAGLSVLVVEDIHMIGHRLAEGLTNAGARVIGPIATVGDALNALHPLPDIATLDVQLGQETSFPIADELVRLGVPFVFATAAGNIIPAAHRERIVCAKPYTIVTILSALHRALADAGIRASPLPARPGEAENPSPGHDICRTPAAAQNGTSRSETAMVLSLP